MRHLLRSIARTTLVFLLATQAALAAAPCVSAGARAADALIPMPPGCEQAPPANLCLQHCIAGDQSSGQAAPALPARPLALVQVLPLPQSGPPRVAFAALPAARALGPPIPIRNLSLLL